MSVNIKKDYNGRGAKPDVTALVYGKVPPQAPQLEEAVLGTIMLERDKLDEILRIIRSSDCFYVDAHQKIYGAIMQLVVRGSGVDMNTVAEALNKSGDLELVGGRYALAQITMGIASTAHVIDHARIVMEKYMQREVIRICGLAISESYDDSDDVFEILERAEIGLSNIIDHMRSGNIKRFDTIILDTVREMQEAAMSDSTMLGVTTGLRKLDEITLGFSAPDLIILAAGTREGKTTFALNSAKAIAQAGTPVGFFSLEMRDKQLMLKILSSEIQEDVKTLRTGKFSDEKWAVLTSRIVPAVGKLPICVYDVGGLNIIELKAIARTMKKKHKVGVIFIDYIQLVRGAGKKFGTREEEVNFVSKELKSLAMELDVPVVVLSQLSRIKDQRTYQLTDLRESGAIEQDADSVLFIYRPILHKLEQLQIGDATWYFQPDDAIIEIAKCRLGEEGTIRAKFYGQFNQFSDYSDVAPGFQDNPYAGISPTTYNDQPF